MDECTSTTHITADNGENCLCDHFSHATAQQDRKTLEILASLLHSAKSPERCVQIADGYIWNKTSNVRGTRQGNSMKKKYLLTDDQVESIVKLIKEEKELNAANGDEAYNTHWDNIIMAFGYAVIN